MGRKALPPEERARRQKIAKAKYYAKRKGKPKSWLKSLEQKLENAAEIPETADATPPDRPGEPFADLPPLDLPGTTASVPGADADTVTGETNVGSASDASSAAPENTSKPKTEEPFLNTEAMQQMAEEGMYAACMFLGKYAADRGQFALGEMPCKLAGKAAAVLVKDHAKNLDIDDETGAAWIVGGVVGVNGVQAFRAFRIEKQKEEEAKGAHVDAKPEPKPEQPVNGAASPTAVPAPHFVPSEKQIIVRPGELV